MPRAWGSPTAGDRANTVPMLELEVSSLSPPHPLSREHPSTIVTKLPGT